MNENNHNFQFKKMISKKLKAKIIIIGSGVLFSLVPLFLLLFLLSAIAGLLPNFITASMVDVKNVYDGSDLVAQLQEKYNLHNYKDDLNDDGEIDYKYSEESAEDNNYFQELIRQKYIWDDDYSEFGFNHNDSILRRDLIIENWKENNKDFDLARFTTLTNYRGTVNILSMGEEFNDGHDDDIVHDDVKLSDYEGEQHVYNRDTRDFYKQAEERIGSSFFLYPGMRELMGNSIKATITFDKIHPRYQVADGATAGLLANGGDIVSNWTTLGKMFMPGEKEYNSYLERKPFLGLTDAQQYYVNALNYGYHLCEELKEKPDDMSLWDYKNICYDYNMMYTESNYVKAEDGYPTASRGLLEKTINSYMTFEDGNQYAELPTYDCLQKNNENKCISFASNVKGLRGEAVSLEQIYKEMKRWFITVSVKRSYDENLYENYLKEVYIPALYTECEGCEGRTVEGVYAEIQQAEEAYRYFNYEEFTPGDISGGSTNSANINYTCSNGSKPHVATYTDHHGLDINSVPYGSSIYPLFEGEVVHVANSCSTNYPPQATSNGGYSCATANSHNCGYGTYVVVRGIAADGNQYDAMYAHLSGVNVTVGQKVSLTTVIGSLGNSGCSTGPHLHLELRDDYTKKSTWHLPTYPGYSYEQVAGTLCSREVTNNNSNNNSGNSNNNNNNSNNNSGGNSSNNNSSNNSSTTQKTTTKTTTKSANNNSSSNSGADHTIVLEPFLETQYTETYDGRNTGTTIPGTVSNYGDYSIKYGYNGNVTVDGDAPRIHVIYKDKSGNVVKDYYIGGNE